MFEPASRFPMTLVLTKQGNLHYLGHRDWARAVARGLRRSGLPLQMTQGFRPHPRMVLPEPLPVGVRSDGERFVCFFDAAVTPEDVQAAVQGVFPAGMELAQIWEGDRREKLDDAVDLEIRSDDVVALGEAARQLDLGPLGLEALAVENRSESVALRLTPPAGRRVSIGRFVRTLRSLQEEREGWVKDVARRLSQETTDAGEGAAG